MNLPKLFFLKKILVIRFSSIGDIVLTTPVLRCLKQQLPGVQIHYLTKSGFGSLLKANPYIDKLHFFEKDLKGLMEELKEEDFDEIIDLHSNMRSRRIIVALRIPFKMIKKLNIKKWLLVNFHIDLLPKVHLVDRYMNTVHHLGIVNDHKGLDHFIPQEDEVDIKTLPAPFNTGYIAFAIGGQHATKRLPDSMILEICKKIQKPVVLLGGKEDVQTADKIISTLGESNIFNGCGKYNINQSSSLVKQSIKVIAHDTGLMHIAAAFKKDIISVWGNTVPEFGMYPYLPGENSMVFEVKDLPCRPCTKLGYPQCPQVHFNCMMLHDVNGIAEAANK